MTHSVVDFLEQVPVHAEQRPKSFLRTLFGRPTSLLGTLIVLLFLFLFMVAPSWVQAQEIPAPEEFFGFQMGADRKLAHWDDMLEYYDLINERSDRVLVRDMGPSTLVCPTGQSPASKTSYRA